MSEMSEKDRISAAYNSFMNAMDMIPGYRAYRRTVQDLLNRAQGKEGTYNPTEFARDLGYSTVPFYTAYDNWLYDRPQNWQQNMIDAATVAIPTAAAGTRVLNQVVKNPKAGFARNPIEYNKLAPKDQALVDRAIEDWNARVAAKGNNPRPQKQPQFQEFADENLNENMWDLIDEFQFYPIVRNKLESGLKTRAIKPENTADAGFLRHQLSNYDPVTNSMKKRLEADMERTGTLPRYEKGTYDDQGHFAKLFPTVEGGKTDLGNNVKSQVLEALEGKFPGYLDAFEGRGPRQPINKKYELNYNEFPYVTVEQALEGKIPWSEAQKRAKELDDNINFWETVLNTQDLPADVRNKIINEALPPFRNAKMKFDQEEMRRALEALPGEH